VTDLGKILITLGGLLVIFGLLLMLGGRLHLPFGRLPGDIVYRGKNTTIYFPIATSIILSILLSLIFWLIGRFGR
jgi:ribose/xylose/arabinose/galactoside ABC-type transport system permease subunit